MVSESVSNIDQTTAFAFPFAHIKIIFVMLGVGSLLSIGVSVRSTHW